MKKKKYLKQIILGIAIFFIFFQLWFFWGVLFYDSSKIPGIFYLTDRNGEVITDKANKYGYKKSGNIDLDSEFVKNLLIIEDKNFYSHFGVDILAKMRALSSNISQGGIVSGGSTITEQFIKNKYFQKEKRGYFQKIKEANIAFFFTVFSSKDEILKNYLKNVYFGNNLYGINSAIETYFQKEKLTDLTQEEITVLLTLIRYPSVKNLKDKTFSGIFEQIQKRLGFTFERTIFSLQGKENIDMFPFVTSKFCEGEKLSCIGKTSIDKKLQVFSKNILKKALRSLVGKNVTNGAVLAFNPETMETLVYLGSKDFYSKEIDGQVDILEALRQPGSTMKPFLYLQALENGASIHSFLLDLKSEYDSFLEGKTYFSENYSLKEYGLVRFAKTLGNSLNNATVRLAKHIGLEKVFDFYKKNGIVFLKNNVEFYGYSLVLGSPSLTLKNLAISYTNLLPNFETRTDRKLNFAFVEKREYKERKLDKNKYLLYQILGNPDNRDVSFGVNSILNTSIFQAVKTGTSTNFKDNIVISYNPNFIMLVWVGNNDNSSMRGVTGITGAGYIWHQIIEEAIEEGYIRKSEYKIPEGIEKKEYCLDINCFRKEISDDKKEAIYFSRIVDKNFSKKDVFINISEREEQRLKELGIYLTE